MWPGYEPHVPVNRPAQSLVTEVSRDEPKNHFLRSVHARALFRGYGPFVAAAHRPQRAGTLGV